VVLVSHHAVCHADPARKGGLIFCEGNNATLTVSSLQPGFSIIYSFQQYNMGVWIPKHHLYYPNRPVILDVKDIFL
jgi:hypothetical protein